MAIDDLDRSILQALLEDGSASARSLAKKLGSTTPTVSARIKRLHDLGVLRGICADVALPQFGHLVALWGPATRVEDLSKRTEVFEVYRTAGNRVHGLALFGSSRELEAFQHAFPDVETHVLVRQEHAAHPRLPPGAGAVSCHECGKRITDGPIALKLGDRRYVACCRSCEGNLRARHAKLSADA